MLRHTTASLLVMQGVDLTTVRDILRHKSIEMTLRYSHLAPAHRKAAVDALEEALKPSAVKEPKTA
jgi:site-specific recombinase XerD